MGLLILVLMASRPVRSEVGFSVETTLRFAKEVEQIHTPGLGKSIWTTDTGWSEAGLVLQELISAAASEGLEPADYHLDSIFESGNLHGSLELEQQHFLENRLQMEYLLTDAYLGYGMDLAGGRTDLSALPEKWIRSDRGEQTLARLKQYLIKGSFRDLPNLGLGKMRPNHSEYNQMLAALEELKKREKTGLWQPFPAGPTLRPGMSDSRIPQLRSRLFACGDLQGLQLSLPGARSWQKAFEYDSDLAVSVRAFQGRHGLVVDGIVASQTRAALNVSDDKLIKQILLNLERLRWLPDTLGQTFIRVNIPDFKLEVRKGEDELFSTRAIVGRPGRPTPVLTGSVSSLVVNPFWNVPQKLARRDLLPKIKTDSTWLAERNFRVYESWASQAPEVELSGGDWNAIKPWDMAFKFRQDPGPRNPLGKIKFLFDNKFSVFIHDTNHKEGFAQRRRAFSSGCIRIEDPLALAQLLVNVTDKDSLSVTGFNEVLESDENRKLALTQAIPVHLLYLTCWVDDAGKVQFREDIYGYDTLLTEALRKDSFHQLASMPMVESKTEEGIRVQY